MPGLFDLIQTAMGRPNPSTQLAAALGQAPGQPGSNAGPIPGAPPPGAPGGGAPPSAQGGAQAAPGGAAGAAPQQPPTPQVYQSPPDLSQMYLQLAQRASAERGFNSGLAMIAAGAYPGRTPGGVAALSNAMNAGAQDPGSLMGNFMQLQMYNQQAQRYADLVNNSASYAKAFGIDPDMFKATITAAGPQGAGQVLGKIAEAQMGLTGTQLDKEYKQAIRNFQAANPNTPLPPELQSEAGFAAQQTSNVATAKQKADDLVADQHNFAPALTNYDKAIGLIDQFNTPDMQEGAKEFLGTAGSMRPVATMDPKGKAAWALYKQIMATQFAAGTQDFRGAGRITQSELTQDAPSQSTMGQLNQDPSDFFNGVAKYRDQLAAHRANLFGAAQKATDPRLSDEDYAKYVAPNIDVFGGPKRNLPDLSKMSDDDADAAVAKLPSGAVFIGPDGQAHKKN